MCAPKTRQDKVHGHKYTTVITCESRQYGFIKYQCARLPLSWVLLKPNKHTNKWWCDIGKSVKNSYVTAYSSVLIQHLCLSALLIIKKFRKICQTFFREILQQITSVFLCTRYVKTSFKTALSFCWFLLHATSLSSVNV